MRNTMVGGDGSCDNVACARPPSQNPPSRFPATGSPGALVGWLSDRGMASTLSADLVDPASRSPLRRTWSRCQPKVEASAHYKDDPPAPKLRLSDRTTESSSPQSTARALIFDPAALIATGWSEPVSGRLLPLWTTAFSRRTRLADYALRDSIPSRPSPIGAERCEHSQIRLRSYAGSDCKLAVPA
jgi:hypothetical protein